MADPTCTTRCTPRTSSGRTTSGEGGGLDLALRAAAHDLVAWLDADDYWDRHHCAVVASLLDEHPAAAVAFSAMRFVGARTDLWRRRTACTGPARVLWECFDATIVPASSGITRRQAALDVGGFREEIRTAPDFEFWIRMAFRYPFVWTQQATANYRWHDHQISRDPAAQLRSVYRSRSLLAQETEQRGDVELADRMRNRTRDLLDKELVDAWRRADRPRVRDLLAVGKHEGLDTPAYRKILPLSRIPAPFVQGWRTARTLLAGRVM